jgi:hypothetical protein
MAVIRQLLLLLGVVSGYYQGMNPGVQVRLEQKTIDAFKKAMEIFLPHFINVDM